jgi:hypothetical protein
VNRRQRQGKYAAEHRHMRDRLLAAYAASPDDLRDAGRLWYPTAQRVIADLAESYAVGLPAAAGVVAALSPQTRWRKNVEGARCVFQREDWRVVGYGANKRKARRIADGASPVEILGGDKVCAFWANLVGSRTAVTIDVWATRAALGIQGGVRYQAEQPKGTRYKRFANAYTSAAEIVGETPPRLPSHRVAGNPADGRTRPRSGLPTRIGGGMNTELSRAAQIAQDRAANERAIQVRCDAMRPAACGQCGNPHPGTLVEGICADCQRDNQLSLLTERGERITGHSRHDDPGPMGDYYEGEPE